MIADQTQYQALYNPKKLRMLMALMNQQMQAPQPNIMSRKPVGQQGNLGALAKGMPSNLPGRPIRPPIITNRTGRF